MRFRAESHLRRQADFQHVRTLGRRYDCGAFMLWYALREPEPIAAEAAVPAGPGPRVGVVASRAAVGNAVQRNRAKRRMRELFRHHQHRVPPEWDLLMVARRSINRLEYAAIEQRFVAACARLFPAPRSDA